MRSKEMYYEGHGQEDDEFSSGVFWCGKTQENFGPDGQPVPDPVPEVAGTEAQPQPPVAADPTVAGDPGAEPASAPNRQSPERQCCLTS